MRRVCFQLQVDPSRLEEYTAKHAAVWPDMLDAIAASGRRNYSLFLRPDGLLVGYFEVDDLEASQRFLAESPAAARWETEMAELFPSVDGRADQEMVPLREIFQLEQQLDALPPHG